MLTAIITFERSYFNFDLQIAMRNEGAGSDINYISPSTTSPLSFAQAVNSSL